MLEHVGVVAERRRVRGELVGKTVERLDEHDVAGIDDSGRRRVGVEDELMRGGGDPQPAGAVGDRHAGGPATGPPATASMSILV